MQPDVTADLEALDATLTTVEKVLDLEELRRRIDELEMQASDPELWNDQDHAQKVTSALSHAQAEMRRVTELRQRLDDLPVHYELADAEEGDDRATAWPTPTPSVNRCAATSRRWKSRRCWPANTTSATPW